jgi:tetratricopeptide (TPR) repeat protein
MTKQAAWMRTFWRGGVVNRAIVITAVLLAITSVTFGIVYYLDRYVHPGVESPVEQGVSSLEEMVRENPDDPDTRVMLAQSYYANGMFPEAKEQAAQVLKAFPENEDALLLSGIASVKMGDSEGALAPLEAFTALRRDTPTAGADHYLEAALYYLGISFIDTGEPGKAIEALQEALVINKMDADAIYQLGVAYAMNGQHEEAIEQFAHAVRFVPDFTEVYTAMATSYAALGMDDYAAYAKGMQSFSLQDYEAARTQLNATASSLRDFGPLYLGLGLTYEQLGDLDNAREELERAVLLNPNDYAAMQALGRIDNLMANQDG